MDIRPLTLCLAAALIAACHSCSSGKEFITTFITNFQEGKKDHLLELILTAQKVQADVEIQVASLDFHKKVTLIPGQPQRISLPPKAELKKQFINKKSAIRITSTAQISVISLNRRTNTGDGAVVSPVEDLGTDYVVYTPVDKSYNSLVGIVNGDSQNTITITPSKDLALIDRVDWKKGEKVTVTLEPHDTYLLRGKACLTGTRIQSQKPVAVLVGHQCLNLGLKCDHVYEQIPPMTKMGNEYVVSAAGSSKAESVVAIVTSEDKTVLTVTSGTKTAKQTVEEAGTSSILPLPHKKSVVIKSDKKVMVLLLSSNKPHDPFLTTIIPTCKLSNNWEALALDGYTNTISIVSRVEGTSSVEVCLGKKCSGVKNWLMSSSEWAWTELVIGRKEGRVTVTGDSDIAVYAYGGEVRRGYGIAGVCIPEDASPRVPVDPCENVQCLQKERCENGKCVPTSSATCHALGDPHYCSFDRRCYDFQGSCTYVMATVVKEAPGLTPFTVTTKNNHRGSKRVTFVREVAIKVYDVTLTISKHSGRIEVNGVLQYLPFSLLDGKIEAKMSGTYAVVTTDFGLVVKYDWNTRLYITVPSSYFDLMGGLCGNYNGDKKDDLPQPTGKKMPFVLEMIQKWKVPDPDLFCNDNCNGGCPECSEQQQNHFRQPKRCGLMTLENGPFAACHSVVNPQEYLNDCVYDVCFNKGLKQFLCDSLKNYFDACLSAKVTLGAEWREQSGCIPRCPAGSQYKACSSACPASCSNLDSEKNCQEPCVEACQCNEGFVLSGNRCVPKAQCGCQYQGNYYPAGTNFWGDNTCTSRCKCKNGEVKCKAISCKKSEECAVKKGIRDCYPTSSSLCRCSGDPHCLTFDKKKFDFMGKCSYVLTKLKAGSTQNLVPFEIHVTNENRGRNTRVSYTKSATIVLGNFTVGLSRTKPGKLLVNERVTNLPYSSANGEIEAFKSGRFGVIKTDFGVLLAFNWNSYVSVVMPSSYSGETEGLCGNFNGNKDDDFTKPDGTQTGNVNEFGNSWQVGGGDAKSCAVVCPGGKCSECEPASIQKYKEKSYCGIISDTDGPFSDCHSKLDPTPYLDDCGFDMCMFKGHSSNLCNSLSAFTVSCQRAGAKVENWRSRNFCPLPCGPNSHYETCAQPCQPTCGNLAPPDSCDESAPCVEACVCNDFFVLSNDKCVPLGECGCEEDGQYYERGEVFFPKQSCDERCVCSDGGLILCDDKFKCSEHEECVLKDGSLACQPKSTGSCSVSGTRTVSSFDGQAYPLYGDCVFTLSAVEEEEESDAGQPAYSVTLQQETREDGSVSRNVGITVYGTEITMETGKRGQIKVDGVSCTLPRKIENGKGRVYHSGLFIVVETDFGVELIYDPRGSVILRIPSTYQGAPKGLCGNFNADLSDDLVEGDPLPTAAASLVQNGNIQCEASCGAAACPEPDKNKAPEAIKACDIIKAQEGPFSDCHSVENPDPFFNDCVTEMVTFNAEGILCDFIQRYSVTCQLAGVKIKQWRSEEFCPLKCSPGSHYELCASTASSTCASLEEDTTPTSTCLEGCQCDGEMLFDGAECVSVQQCGCFVDGVYYKSGTSELSDDCSEICSCQSGKLICEENSCQEGQECRNKDGTIGCFDKDPCADLQCRLKEHCEVVEDQGVCVADSKALCWAFGDPHFTMFDGTSYSFQGTCSYLLFATTGLDPTLPEIRVTMKGELRGNSKGSFVHSLTVEMLGYTIYIPSGLDDLVLVNGIKEERPVFLEDGRIGIIQSGIRGTIQSDLGIEIVFDWASLVMITVSSSYFGNTAGLCGTYTENRADDMTTATGNLETDVVTWASSWSVPDGDIFCFHECQGECPVCSDEDRQKYSGPEYCGILSDEAGPFAGCHSIVPVKEFVDDCLYDVCLNDGQTDVLCEALGAYLAECQAVKAPVSPWRGLAGCPIQCPANSHYEECGTACPETCSHQPEICPSICAEGCFCDGGFVLSGSECVNKETGCGCEHDGHYHEPGETFWSGEECSEKCICDPDTHKSICKPAGCGPEEICTIIDGHQDCYPTKFETCTARGDPHFLTYDGNKYDFQGNCLYTLSKVCKPVELHENFEVIVENENRNNKKVSYAKAVTLKVFNMEFTLSRENPGKVLVDGLERTVPFHLNDTPVQAYVKHRSVVVQTHFLKLSYDFSSSVKLEVASVYKGATCGLCGNMNEDPADDFMMSNGELAASANLFGVSQLAGDKPGCSLECKDCPPALPADFTPPAFTEVCKIIRDQKGPLADCTVRLPNFEDYYNDCVYDVFLTGGDEAVACDSITNYVADCQNLEGQIKEWRTEKFCPMVCPPKSEYTLRASGCPITCSSRSPPVPCKISPGEGCVCKQGTLMSKDGCVNLAKCGCNVRGRYLEPGEGFYEDSDCKNYCKCKKGVVACKEKPCKKDEECTLVKGVRGCFSKKDGEGGDTKQEKEEKKEKEKKESSSSSSSSEEKNKNKG